MGKKLEAGRAIGAVCLLLLLEYLIEEKVDQRRIIGEDHDLLEALETLPQGSLTKHTS